MADDQQRPSELSAEQLRQQVENPVQRLISTYARPYHPFFVFSIIASILAQILYLFIPVIVGRAFDAILIGSEPYRLPVIPGAWIPNTVTGQFWFSGGLIAGFYVTATLITFCGNWATNLAAFRLQHDLRTEAYSSMQRLDMAFFESFQSGDLMSTLNNDVNNIDGFFSDSFIQTQNAIIIFSVATTYMLVLHWQLALVALIFPFINGGLNYWYSRHIEPHHQEKRSQVAEINNRIENNISGMDLIKIYNRESYEADRVVDESGAYKNVSWGIFRVRELISRITAWLPNAGYSILFLVGGYWVLNGPPLFFSGPLAGGTLLSFLMYNNRLAWPLKQVTSIIDHYQEVKAMSGRIFGVLDAEPLIENRANSNQLDTIEGRVTYENITFAYPGDTDPTISDVSFTAEPGEMLGLVGPTGAGKSTILKLLMRFYDADEGKIRVDGHHIRDISLETFRQSIGYVGQDPYLFHGTIRENIAYSRPDAEDSAIKQVARKSGAHEFIKDLPDGYETKVGQRGKKLSGGQRQRISIARALFSDPEILILDEATSHVDNETEALIQTHLEDLIADRTTFVIAHRLSTVKSADKILVFKDGQVVERGNHDELLDIDGVYSDLWKVQEGEIDSLPTGFLERDPRPTSN